MTAKHDALNVLLADYQILYQKLRSYHWNVQGPMFFELHAKFEELYLDAAQKVDELAERILAVGGRPVSSLKGALKLARLKEDEGGLPAAEMVANLVDDFGALNVELRAAAKLAASDNDAATFNLLEGMADGQEKTAWMLRAFLA